MQHSGVEPGSFPFPLIDGPEESRYLTWVRNNSDYMAERGFLDYMRILAVLVRGILINFLTVLPWLLGFALVIGLVYGPLLREWGDPGGTASMLELQWANGLRSTLGTSAPFLFTPWVGAGVLFWFLIFPAVIRLFKVATHARSVATGSESSVKLRDKYERSFDGALLVVAGVAAIEATPYVVHFFHGLLGRGIREVVAGAMGAGSLIAVSAAGKLLSVLKDRARGIAMLLVGLLGLALPALVVLYVVEDLVYDTQLEFDWQLLLIVPITIILCLVAAIVVGKVKKALESPGWLLLQLAVASGVTAAILIWHGSPQGPAWFFVLAFAIEIWAFCWLAVDINLTSVHGLYRDRLASAYLVGENRTGDVDIEEDLDLHEIAEYEAGSVAPYHLINVALNLQASHRVEIRERNSDFFIFSKRFIGGRFTGYCRSGLMESVFPQIDLATAMAISAAAASPNMGVFTNKPLVAVMTLLNVRLGYWVPNPGVLERKRGGYARERPIHFEDVFERELEDLQARWSNVGYAADERHLAPATDGARRPTPDHGLFGIGFSGGGIRSATINLGIAQVLDARGVLRHADYLSTVSGGGYLGASMSTLMRRRHAVWSLVREELRKSLSAREFAPVFGAVRVEKEDGCQLVLAAPNEESRKKIQNEFGERIVEAMERLRPRVRLVVRVSAKGPEVESEHVLWDKLREELEAGMGADEFTRAFGAVWAEEEDDSRLALVAPDEENRRKIEREFGERIVEGMQRLKPPVQLAVNVAEPDIAPGTLRERFNWRVRPTAFLREILGRLDDRHRWVNLSDGGHIENLAAIELLRRRCKFIIIGDGGGDPRMHFDGMAILIRYARIDLGIQIDISLDELRLDENGRSKRSCALGRVRYPGDEEPGYLLYLKSAFLGDEDEVIQEYRNRNPLFPHESTADQAFDEGQFEAYRALGQHIGECALALAPKLSTKISYAEVGAWFGALRKELHCPWSDETE